MVNSETYDARVLCTNCHARYQITIRRGTQIAPAVMHVPCDMCGCDTLVKDPHA